MSVARLLEEVGRLGAELVLKDDGAVLRQGSTPVPPDTLAALREHKAEIVAFLCRQDEEDRQAEYEERAALVEVGAGVPREWAEGFAALDVAKPPKGMKADEWRRLIDNAADFIEHHAARAAALGWSAEEIFGVRPSALGSFYGLAGLLPNLRADRVVEVLADRVALRTATGNITHFYRRPPEGDVKPFWSLLTT